jgi:hypothetical protein
LVTSSTSPASSAGVPASPICAQIVRNSAGSTGHTDQYANAIPAPPIRGVGAVWNF